MIRHMGGVRGFQRNCKGLFTEFVGQLPKLNPNSPAYAADLRSRQGIISDLVLDATSINLSEYVA